MKVAIIGAGAAGLAAARELKQTGNQGVIFEKSKAVGGRMATRRLGEFVFDSGAQSFVPRDTSLATIIPNELDTTTLRRVEKPVFTHDGRRASAGDRRKNEVVRYTYTDGANKLGKLLAEGLEIRRESEVEKIEKSGSGYVVAGEEFEGVILTAPIPQSAQLLWGLGSVRPTAQCRYRPCLSVLLGYELPNPAVPYHALVNVEGTHPLQWLSIESLKVEGRAPEGCCAIVAQLNGPYSLNAWSWPDEKIVESTTTFVSWILGPEWTHPVASDVKKWKYSQPEETASFDSANRSSERLILAGDGVFGGRVEMAYESGLMAAREVVTR